MILNLEQRKRLAQRQEEHRLSMEATKDKNITVPYTDIKTEGNNVYITLKDIPLQRDNVPNFNLGHSREGGFVPREITCTAYNI